MSHSLSWLGRIGSGPKRRQDATAYSGDTLSVTVTVKDDTNTAIDLTGATAEWRVCELLASGAHGTAEITLTTAAGVMLSDPTNGQLTLSIAASETDDLDGVYVHELQITDSSGAVSTVSTGRLTVKNDLVTP